MTPNLNPYLDGEEPSLRITEPRIIDCAIILATAPGWAGYIKAQMGFPM